jgi:hypothetical protein
MEDVPTVLRPRRVPRDEKPVHPTVCNHSRKRRRISQEERAKKRLLEALYWV